MFCTGTMHNIVNIRRFEILHFWANPLKRQTIAAAIIVTFWYFCSYPCEFVVRTHIHFLYHHSGIQVSIPVPLYLELFVELRKALMPPTQISKCILVVLLLLRWGVEDAWTQTSTNRHNLGRRVKGKHMYTRVVFCFGGWGGALRGHFAPSWK